MLKPYYETKLGKLYHGDCLEIMPELDRVDLVLTDPPYSSGGQFRSDRSQKTSSKYVQRGSVETCKNEFAGDNRDQRSFLAWSTMWLSKAFAITNPGGCLLIFTDWRQLPTMTDAVQCGGWVWRNIVTWWKPGIRMQRGRFSSSAEYLLYCSKGVPIAGEKSPQNVISNPPVLGKNKVHIAEKPIGLIQTLIGITEPGATVLDIFSGGGTTALACEQTGRKWICIEILEQNCDITAQRIENENQQIKLFAG